MQKRNYIQARNLHKEAKEKLKDYSAILGRTHKDYTTLRKKGILCKAFSINGKTSNKK